MARTLIVSDRNNSFFTANNIKVGTEIPTSGTYSKGDIVVNIGNNTATEAMWICVEAGTPGTWEVVGAGAGGGSGSLVAINDTVTINNSVREVSLGNLVGKISSSDKLIVHYNSTHLMEGIDYEVNSEGTKIVKLTEGSWNESGEQALFAFELFKNVESVNGNEIVVDTKLTSIVNNIMIPAPTTEVEIGVDGFNKNSDTLLVFKNGVIMVEGVDYNVNEDNTKIISINEVWNESNVEEYGITFVVFKEVVVYDGATGGITMGMLGSDVREILNNLTETTLQHSNLLEDMDGKYATKEDLENIEVDLSPYQQKTDNNLQTSSKNLVGAINELFQNANNGKELIANAIGEPLDSNDTFSAMSNDINSLLSTFKTNMMNNGVSVAGTDKFKQLIDKIATLADSEGKGIKYKTGNLNDLKFEAGTSTSETRTVNVNFEFTPNIVFIEGKTIGNIYGEDNIPVLLGKDVDVIINDQLQAFLTITSYNSTSITFKFRRYTNESGTGVRNLIYHAIGVGEEDTTLRDSLASILQDEGVDVTEEDDMASLITKVDQEFDRKNANSGLDIISATELPSTGKENQICVITDSPVDEYMIYQFEDDMSDDYTGIGIMLSNVQSTTNVTINGNPGFKMHILSIKQNNESLDSYIYTNGTWEPLTISRYILLSGGVRYYEDKFGYFDGSNSDSCDWISNQGYFVDCSYRGGVAYARNDKLIDFSKYSKITITIADKSSSLSSVFEADGAYLACLDSDGITIKKTGLYKNGTYTLDISNVNSSGYIAIGDSCILANSTISRFLITYICIE